MTDNKTPRIALMPVQIMPAEPGWLAVFLWDKGELLFNEIVCWALCQGYAPDFEMPNTLHAMAGPDSRYIVGCVVDSMGISIAEQVDNFLGYMRTGSSPEDTGWWQELYGDDDSPPPRPRPKSRKGRRVPYLRGLPDKTAEHEKGPYAGDDDNDKD